MADPACPRDTRWIIVLAQEIIVPEDCARSLYRGKRDAGSGGVFQLLTIARAPRKGSLAVLWQRQSRARG